MNDALIAQAREMLAKRNTTERHVYHGLIRDWLLSYHLDVPTELVEQAEEITRLRALLPHTADGVLIADCEVLYCPKCNGPMVFSNVGCFCDNHCFPEGAEETICLSKSKEPEHA